MVKCTLKFGLIGHPISHSLSPALFKAGYDGRYQYELIESPDFDEAYGKFLNEYDGINVTAPFKESAYDKADILSEECRLIKASNLLIKTPEGVKAYNSDYLGVRRWIKEQQASLGLPEPKVLVAGLGGAGKAAAVAAGSLGLETTLMNRTASKAGKMVEELPQFRFKARPIEEFAEAFRENDIVIYTLPSAIEQMNQLSKEEIDGKEALLEANYRNPALRNNGKIWLLYQAAEGYDIFTGEKPDLSKMSDVL